MKNLIILIVFSGVIFLTVLSGCDSEKKSWQETQKENTINAYKEFLKNYPESEYTTGAKEEIVWKQVHIKNITGAYEHFLQDYPESKYVQKAEKRIDSLLFESAKRINTVFSYKHFLEKIPETRYEDQIYTLLKKLKQDRLPVMRNVETVYLKIIELFPEGYDLPKLEIEEKLKSIFNDIFITLINDEEKADAVLKVNIAGKALEKYYTGIGMKSGSYYSGAIISGNISLIKNDKKILSVPVYHKISCPESIGEEYLNPSDAPFTKAFHQECYPKINMLLMKTCNHLPVQMERFNTGYSIVKAPVVVDDIVYIGANDYYIYAFNVKEDKLKWKFETSLRVNRTPIVVEDFVYIGSADGYLYALDVNEGTLKWKFKTAGYVDSAPAVVDNVIYFGSDDDNIYALDAKEGTLKWKYKTEGDVETTPTVVDSIVYVGSKDQHLYIGPNKLDQRIKCKMEGPHGSETLYRSVQIQSSLRSN